MREYHSTRLLPFHAEWEDGKNHRPGHWNYSNLRPVMLTHLGRSMGASDGFRCETDRWYGLLRERSDLKPVAKGTRRPSKKH